MHKNRYIVVLGCGSLGSFVAEDLSGKGDSVVVIDRDDSAFERLSIDFSGFRLSGDATRITVLREAKLQEADIFIASTNEDNSNLMAAQMAKRIFGVPRVLARSIDPRKMELYSLLGIETICQTSIAARMFLEAAETIPAGDREVPS